MAPGGRRKSSGEYERIELGNAMMDDRPMDFPDDALRDEGQSSGQTKLAAPNHLRHSILSVSPAASINSGTAIRSVSSIRSSFSEYSPPPETQPEPKNQEEAKTAEYDQISLWHPKWLRPVVLGGFGVLFLGLTVALPVMLVVSQRNNGLGEADQDLVYLWRFGPTAIVTLIAVFWSRVELQALRYTPWIKMRRDQHLDPKDYYLDYIEMLPPVALVESFKRRHFLAFSAVLTTFILKIQVVLSASIFQSVSSRETHSVSAIIWDSFSVPDDLGDSLGGSSGTSSYAQVLAVNTFNVSLPFGVSETCAYQEFSRDMSKYRPIDPLTVTVDGFFMDTECLLVEDCTTSTDQPENSPDRPPTLPSNNFVLGFEKCDHKFTLATQDIKEYRGDGSGLKGWYIEQLPDDERPCTSLPQEHPQFLYFASKYNQPRQSQGEIDVEACAAVLCSGHSWTSKVEVVDDGINPKITTSKQKQQEDKNSVDINPWKLLAGAVPHLGYPVLDEDTVGPLDVYHSLTTSQDVDVNNISLYDSETLRQTITGMTDLFGPTLAHNLLREPNKQPVVGSTTALEDRLVARLRINLGISVSVAVLFALCAFSAFFALWQSLRIPGPWHRDPATVLGSMMYAQAKFHPTGIDGELSRTMEFRKTMWRQCNDTPLSLKSWLRGLLLLYVLGLISGLAATLQTSHQNSGLSDVSEEGYWFLLWQSLPTLAMLLVSLHSSSSDAAIRGLAVLSNLSIRTCSPEELDLSFLDMLGFRAFYYSIRHRIPAVTLSQALATICCFLPALASVLFSPVAVLERAESSVQQESWFGFRQSFQDDIDPEYRRRRDNLGGLNLMRNLSTLTFPEHTYNDLVFPTFNLSEVAGFSQDKSAEIKVPAAKLVSSCAKLSEKEINMTYNEEERPGAPDFYFEEPYTCPNGTDFKFLQGFELPPSEEAQPFGFMSPPSTNQDPYIKMHCDVNVDSLDESYRYPPWISKTYIWGKSSASNAEFDHLAIWRCNYTWAEITTRITMRWGNDTLVLDDNNRPAEDESSIRSWSPPFSIPTFSNNDVFPEKIDIENTTRAHLHSSFMGIVQPFTPLSLDALGEEDQEEQILQALHSSLGFFAAQLANLENRLNLSETSDMAPTHHDELRPLNVTIMDFNRHRLQQHYEVTWAIMAILGLVALGNLWVVISDIVRSYLGPKRPGWRLLHRDTNGLAPLDFGSVAMAEALLEGSNSLRYMPEGAHLMPSKELFQHLAGRQFRMGWFFNSETQTDEYTIGVMEDDNFVFQGGKEVGEKRYERVREGS